MSGGRFVLFSPLKMFCYMAIFSRSSLFVGGSSRFATSAPIIRNEMDECGSGLTTLFIFIF